MLGVLFIHQRLLTSFLWLINLLICLLRADVIKAVTHEEVSKEDLGGARRHGETSGVANFICESEDSAFERVRELMTFLPSSNFIGNQGKLVTQFLEIT